MTVASVEQRQPPHVRVCVDDWLKLYAIVGLVALATLSVFARGTAYFAFDPPIEVAVQAVVPPFLKRILDAVSWVGFPPQVDVIAGVVVLALLALGYRWEAVCAGLAAVIGGVSWFTLASLVDRPRPSPELVRVEQMLGFGSYPSGHVLVITAFFGTLFCLALLGLRERWYRPLVMCASGVLVLAIGVARIVSGEHWPSDVLAGYLLGSVIVASTLLLYRWRRRSRKGAPARSPALT